jgi:GntR family transcriptional regulator
MELTLVRSSKAASADATSIIIPREEGRRGRDQIAYRLLADQLRELVKDPEIAAGKALPTETDLVSTTKLGRQTIRRAMQQLVVEGVVYRVPGRGTFAARRDDRYLRYFGSVEDLMGLSIDTTMRCEIALHRRVDVESAGRLRLNTDNVMAVSLVRLHEGVPICWTAVCLPVEVGRLLEDVAEITTAGQTSNLTLLGLLDARLPEPITEADQSISVAGIPAEAAAALGCQPGQPALRIDRLYYTQSGAVELATSWFPGDRYSYRIKLRRNN